MNKQRKTSHILNVFQYDDATGIIGLNGAPVSGYGLYLTTNINDGSVGIDSSASINALYLLKNTTKQFEISYDTSGATKLFRLLPYQSGSFFQIGNPSNAANSNSDYVFISEAVYGNVLIGPGIGNATGNLTGATASIHKVQFNGAVFANNSIQATSFKITGGSSTGFLKADGTVDAVTYLSGNQSITVSGDATGSGTTSIALTLANTAVTPGSYGSTTLVPVVTVDSKGRITSVTTAAISGSLTFTGDVTGSGTTGTSTAMTLAASGVTAGTYTKVTVDTKGRVTVGSSATTSDISEGTNLYYTDARVLSYLSANTYATQSYVSTQINNLVAGAPGLLDTLDELAAALGDDANFATTTATSLGNRLRIDTGAQGLTSTQQGYGRTNLGLGSLATLSSIGNTYITDLAWSKLSSTPTTISGYGITNAYTDAQIQNFFNGANAISGYNKSNWDTAYGWGNHASAGYLTTSSASSTYLTSATAATTYVSLTGSYANPSWITSLAYSKITGVPAFLTSYTETDPYRVTTVAVSGTSTKTITLTRADASTVTTTWTDYDTDTNTYVTSAGFSGGTLTLTRNDAGTVTVSLDGRYYLASNPSSYITSSSLTSYVPYTGATANIDTGGYSITAGAVTLTSNLWLKNIGTYDFIMSNGTSITTNTIRAYYNTSDELRFYAKNTAGSAAVPKIMVGDGTTFYTLYHSANIPTWNQNTTGTAASISGFNNPTTASTANTIAYRDASGDVAAREFVLTAATIHTVTPSSIVGIYPTTNQVVKFSASAIQTFLGLGSLAYSSATIPTNNNQLTNGAGYVTTSGLSTDADSEQTMGSRVHYFNSGAGRINLDPRWNESGYDADLGCLHLWSWTAAGVAYGRAGIAFYSGSAYQYLTTKSGESNLYVNNNAIIHAGNIASQSVSYATTAGSATTANNLAANTSPTIQVLNFTGVGGNSGNANQGYAIYQEGGSWAPPFPDLCIGYHTGIKIGAYFGYNGIRFYNNSDFATQTFSVNDGDNHVRVAYNLYVASDIVYNNMKFTGDQTYGFFGRNVYADTINGRGSDPLELNYYDGGSVIIGTGANGSKALYAGSLYDAGNRVYSAGNPQVNITGTAGSAPNGSNANAEYLVTPGTGNGLKFWSSDNYKISMGASALYYYGPVTDYSIKTQMNDGDTGRGFTWGRISYAPIAALNSTSGNMQIAGTFTSTAHYITGSTNGGYIYSNDWGIKLANSNGYIQFGPANGSWSHIYSDKSFYFNQELYVNNQQVIHSGNIGSQTVATAGNSNSVGGVGIGSIVRKDTTGQYLRAFYQYGSYLTSETPQTLVNEGIQGGGLRVDFMHPAYTGSGGWNHVITWSGYNGYNMYQLGGHYDGGTGTNLWVRSEANHGLSSWTSWRRLLNTSADPYAANMNQNVRTSDAPTFTNIYNSSWFRNNNINEGLYNQATGVHFYSNTSEGFAITGSGGIVQLQFRSNHQSTIRGYVYGDPSSNFGLLDNTGNWQVRLNPSNNGGQLYGNWLFSGAIRRNSHSTGFLEGSYNNVGGNSAYTNPIYTIGSSYNPSDSSLNSMYGVGYAHPNLWGGGKTSDWGLYVCAGGTINATIGSGAVTIWAQYDIVAYSDIRVKDNIEVVTNAIEKIQAIRGVTFTRKDASLEDKDKRHAGVIAQEVLEVMPEVVTGTEKDMYSVAYGNMAALFIEAIKEQQLQIEELKNKLDNVLSSR